MALEADSLHFGRSDDWSSWNLGAICFGVVPLFRFTGLNRPSVVHVRRCNDIDFPESVSYPLRQRLMVQGAVADRTLPVPGVATEEEGWALAEEHEYIQDEVVFADGAWNENAAVFELKDSLDTVLALDVDDAVTDEEVVKEAETAAVERVSVDFTEVDADKKMRRFSLMLWLNRCWLLQGSTSDRVACSSPPAGPGQDAPCEYSAVEFDASYV